MAYRSPATYIRRAMFEVLRWDGKSQKLHAIEILPYSQRDAKTRGFGSGRLTPQQCPPQTIHHLKFSSNLISFASQPAMLSSTGGFLVRSSVRKVSDAEDERTASTIAQPSMMQ